MAIIKCCCTGHRPKGFPFAYGKDEKMHNAYLQALEEKIRFVIKPGTPLIMPAL